MGWIKEDLQEECEWARRKSLDGRLGTKLGTFWIMVRLRVLETDEHV